MIYLSVNTSVTTARPLDEEHIWLDQRRAQKLEAGGKKSLVLSSPAPSFCVDFFDDVDEEEA